MQDTIRRLGITAAVALLALLALTASAQTVTQTLTIDFVGGQLAASVPLGGWLPIVLAGVLALAAANGLRRRGKGSAWLWTTIVVSATALLLDNVPSTEAKPASTPLPLLGSPASAQFTFPGAPPFTEVDATNQNLGLITITNITLSSGPYTIGPAAAAKISGPPPCAIGESLGKSQTCFLDLEIVP